MSTNPVPQGREKWLTANPKHVKYLTRDDGSAGGAIMGWHGAAPTLHHGMWDHWPVAGRFLSKHEGIEGMEAAVQFFGLVVSHGEIREVVLDDNGLRLVPNWRGVFSG